jgi:hypothetical protein
LNATVTQHTRQQQTQCRAQRSCSSQEAVQQDDAILAAGPNTSERLPSKSCQSQEAPKSSDTINTMKRTLPSPVQATLRDSCKNKEQHGALRGSEPLAERTNKKYFATGYQDARITRRSGNAEAFEPERRISLLHVDRLIQFLSLLLGFYDVSSAPSSPRSQSKTIQNARSNTGSKSGSWTMLDSCRRRRRSLRFQQKNEGKAKQELGADEQENSVGAY